MQILKYWPKPETLTVERQMITFALGSMVIFLPIITGVVLHFKLRTINDLVNEKSRAETELICLLSLDALISEDRPVLDTVVSNLESLKKGLVGVQIYNQQGDELASWELGEAADDKVITTTQPITYLGHDFGSAQMRWSYDHFASPIVGNTVQSGMIIMMVGLVLIMLMIWYVQRSFIRPLEYLDDKVRAIAVQSTIPKRKFKIRTREFQNLDRNLDRTSHILRERAEQEAHIIRAEEQVRAAQEAAKAKMDFLSLMSHEIRTPLGVIMGFGKLLATSELDEEDQEFVESINQSGEFLLQIVNDILDLSKIEANGLQLDPAPMSISTLCCEMENMMTTSAKSRGILFNTDCSGFGNQQVIADQHRLKQVLMNLIGNAIKFTEEGYVAMRVTELDAKLDQNGEKSKLIRFEVVDTGVGMSPEIVGKIFRPFSQADDSVSRKYGGTGLGLTISNQLIKMMGGEISVESDPDKGSTFSFEIRLGLAESSADIDTKPDLANQCDANRTGRLKILVAEDERMNRVLIEKVFKRIGYEVCFAKDGQVCVNRLMSGENFDVVFLDLHMPHVGGLSIARKIRDGVFGPEIKNTSLAIMSADVFGAEEGKEIGVDAFIAKPVDFLELEKFLHSVESGNQDPLVSPGTKASPQITQKVEVKHRSKDSGEKVNKLNVLVVEDQKLNQNLIGKVFELFGVNSFYADDGLQCMECLSSQTGIDAILLDLRMPNMDGMTVAQKIRNGDVGPDYQKIPIAIISAEMLGEDECLAMGVDDYIPKPLDINRLRGFVEKVERDQCVDLAG